MSQIVTCDVCGKIYNQRHLSSHQRLAHGKRTAPPPPPKSEEAKIETILSLYERLSVEGKKEVLDVLSAEVPPKP